MEVAVNDLISNKGQGFTILPSFVSTKQLIKLDQSLQSAVNKSNTSNPKRIWNLFTEKNILNYAQPSKNSILANVLKTTLGNNYLLAGSYSNTIHPGRNNGSIHQDYPYNVLAKIEQDRRKSLTKSTSSSSSSSSTSTSSTSTIIPSPSCETVEITTILALNDFTATNGATWIVPNSHTIPLGTSLPSVDSFNTTAVQIICKRGDLIIMHGASHHCSGWNQETHSRNAILCMYIKNTVRPQIDPWMSIPKHIRTTLNKRSRIMLGAHWHQFDQEQTSKKRKHEET